MRRGTTLPELLLVVAMLGLLAIVALPRAGALRDRLSVHGAANDVAALLADARERALLRTERTAFAVDIATGLAVVRIGADTLRARQLRDVHGVTVSATRDSLAYSPLGLGYGAANTSIVVRRNAAAETLFVSRLGRVRRG
jgi:type II secretory pathway pseudopilin PulG